LGVGTPMANFLSRCRGDLQRGIREIEFNMSDLVPDLRSLMQVAWNGRYLIG